MGWLKKFGPAQNILGTVKGQGISNLKNFAESQPSASISQIFFDHNKRILTVGQNNFQNKIPIMYHSAQFGVEKFAQFPLYDLGN